MIGYIFVILLIAAGLRLQAQSQCLSCHPAETKLHVQSHMAHAMSPARSTPFAQHVSDHPLHEASDGFAYSYSPTDAGLQVTAELASKKATGIMEWVLGSPGGQGETPVIRVGKNLFESRVTYYATLNQFGITIGQPAGKSSNASSALGLKESKHDATTCLSCHATGLTKDLEPVLPGVQCERCHEGAAEHAANGGKGEVVNPGKLVARKQVELCGTCHRIKPPVYDSQIENVRFQPLRLIKSRCFISGQVACLTCHPAHVDAIRNNADFYNEKCNACHAGQTAKLQHMDERRTGNCISCHMPVVQLHPGLKFTDHYIRTVAKRT